MAWRLFQGFQKRIKGFCGQHMHFINNVDFIFSFYRCKFHSFPQIADFVNTTIGGRIHFHYIHGRTVGNPYAGRAGIARMQSRSLYAV